MVLHRGSDPKVVTVPGGEDVTSRVQAITILPHRMAQARLLSLRDGKPYPLPGSDDFATETHIVLEITGDWIANVFRLPETA